MDNKIYFVCSKYTVLLETVSMGILLYYTVNLYTTSQKQSQESGVPPPNSAQWLHTM